MSFPRQITAGEIKEYRRNKREEWARIFNKSCLWCGEKRTSRLSSEQSGENSAACGKHRRFRYECSVCLWANSCRTGKTGYASGFGRS